MSFNRSKYDNCSYKNELNRNVGILGYILDINNYDSIANFIKKLIKEEKIK